MKHLLVFMSLLALSACGQGYIGQGLSHSALSSGPTTTSTAGA
jgi:hypothetical protein